VIFAGKHAGRRAALAAFPFGGEIAGFGEVFRLRDAKRDWPVRRAALSCAVFP
jgi:hypothetical protein